MDKERLSYPDSVPVRMKWSPMVVLSIFLHLFIFSAFLFVPESFPRKKPYAGIVYNVRLVEMPSGGGKKAGGAKSAKKPAKKSGKTVVKKAAPAKRIAAPKKKAKPVVIAKRTLKKETAKVKKPEASPSKLIDKAISRIEHKVQKEEKGHVDQAIAKLEQKAKGAEDTVGLPGRGGITPGGMPMMIYRMEVEERIKSNWTYPVALDNKKDIEAVVVLRVRSDGTILQKHFEKRSARSIFDESVMRAIEKSDPLPPFPEGYRKRHEELIISFNLKDLQEQ
jgi:colicin import membrane protein